MSKEQLYQIIFKADTKAGKRFDVILLYVILASVCVVFLESVPDLSGSTARILLTLEWVFTIFFSIEYILRIYCAPIRKDYIFSFFGIVDLLSILPTFLALVIVGSQSLMVIRILRLMRVFRVLKLASFMRQGNIIWSALRNSWHKITVFLVAVFVVITIMGTFMYLIESPEAGFTSIPRSIYWAVVTITTVGYGDIAPQTILGQVMASILMLTGYSIIAVPTGIITNEVHQEHKREQKALEKGCNRCGTLNNETHNYCAKCGEAMPQTKKDTP